jgi:hypothetical protein
MLFLPWRWRFQGAELDLERSSGDGAAHGFCKWHRRAALQRFPDGNPVRDPIIVGRFRGFEGDPGRPRICPARLKLTLTVMSIGLATEAGGGFQHADNLSNRSLSVLT